MSTLSTALRECHRLRKHLKALQEEIDRGPRVLKLQQAALAREEQTHKEAREIITKLKVRQREEEGSLKTVETQLAKSEKQLNDTANQKEYAAKQSEIEQAKAKKATLEDAILATMTEIEERTAALPAVDKQWADAQAEYARQQDEAKERLDRMVADQAASRTELAKHEETLPPKVRTAYDILVKAKGPDALATGKDKVCLGCRTQLTQQRVMELNGGTFVTCPGCGRILYPET
ncbi:MAG TPA: C4-type zinc ribbon domain-containing protein [Gemmataceae bacterium]|nr:C4-type zinc ribbon domain-containing protein [Gemmataceae bacterium]